MRVKGTVLDVERRHGTFPDRETGKDVTFDFTVLHVLDGRAVSIVRLPKEVNALDLPFGKGDEIEAEVSIPSNTKTMYVGVL